MANLVVNGNMELDSDWDDLDLAGADVQERSTGKVHGGSYSRHVSVDAAAEGALEATAHSVVSGTMYRISFWVYVVSGTAEVKDHTNDDHVFSITEATTGSWIFKTEDVVATGTSATQQVRLVSSGGAAEFYIDDLSIDGEGLGTGPVGADTITAAAVSSTTVTADEI